MELVFRLYFYFYFYIYFILKSFFCYMWGFGEDKGDARIPPPPGRVKDGGVMRACRQFGAGGCIVRS